MKNYNEMAQSVFERREKYAAERKRQTKKAAAVASCFCLCALLGVGAWQSGFFSKTVLIKENSSTVAETTCASDAEIDFSVNPTYVPTQGKNDGTEVEEENTEKDELVLTQEAEREFNIEPTRLPSVSQGDKMLPYTLTRLTQEELYDQAGEYLPTQAPHGFAFESASLSDYGYSVLWWHGLDDLNWKIRDYKDTDAVRITKIEDKQNYDLSLYPIPRAESVPNGLHEIVNDPIFRAEELTMDAVYARAYKIDEPGDSSGDRMMFSVLYKNKVITIISKGVAPEWVYEQICTIVAK